MFLVMKQIPALIELSSIRLQLFYSKTKYKAQNGIWQMQFLHQNKALNQELHSDGASFSVKVPTDRALVISL